MICHSVVISAPPEVVFGHYADVSSWPLWDEQVAEVSLPEGLVAGSAGWLKPAHGPRARIAVTEAEAGKSFTVESRLPLCRMIFTHRLETDGTGTRATHCLAFRGPLAFAFRRLLGPSLGAALPSALAGLKRMSEARAQ